MFPFFEFFFIIEKINIYFLLLNNIITRLLWQITVNEHFLSYYCFGNRLHFTFIVTIKLTYIFRSGKRFIRKMKIGKVSKKSAVTSLQLHGP